MEKSASLQNVGGLFTFNVNLNHCPYTCDLVNLVLIRLLVDLGNI